jgi:hypothetical protein
MITRSNLKANSRKQKLLTQKRQKKTNLFLQIPDFKKVSFGIEFQFVTFLVLTVLIIGLMSYINNSSNLNTQAENANNNYPRIINNYNRKVINNEKGVTLRE